MENEIFEKAPVPKAFFTMALPVVFSMVISLVYNMVDTYFIARTGNTNLVAGVSLGAPKTSQRLLFLWRNPVWNRDHRSYAVVSPSDSRTARC